MSPARISRLARVAARLIPPAYRREVLDDIAEMRLSASAQVRAVLKSARDARRAARGPLDDGRAPEPRGSFTTDVVAAVRHLWRRPTAAAWIAGTLAAAMTVSLSLFAVVNAVLLRPLPFARPDRVVFVWNSQGPDRDTLTPARALDIRARARALSGAALIGHLTGNVTGLGPAERWYGASVSLSFFDVLGARPALGRVFHGGDRDRDVVVLSHRLWIDRFAGNPAVIGTAVTLNGRPRTVVGVMAADFFWPSITYVVSAADPPLFWSAADATDVPERPIPFDHDVRSDRYSGYLRMVARLRDEATLETATAEAADIAAQLGREYPETDAGRGIVMVPAREQLLGSVERPLWLLWVGSVLVVLGAAVTVANLLLVQQTSRRREFAVRTALGASRWRLVRQLFAEAAVLAAVAGAAGLAGAALLTRVLISVAPARVGRLNAVSVDASVWGGAVVLAGGVAILLGVISALTLKRSADVVELRGVGAAAVSGNRLRTALVSAEIALAMILVTATALFGASLSRLEAVDVGFDTRNLLTFEIALNGPRAEYQARQLEFFDGLLAKIRAMPGVRSAAGAVTLPIGGDNWGAGFFVEGRPLPRRGEDPRVGFQIVGDGWFETLGMRIVRGRDFRATDTRQAPAVVIINETLAHQAFPHEDPIGRRVKYARDPDAPTLTVIGVVSDIRHLGPSSVPRPEIYQAYHQSSMSMMAVAVRGEGDPLPLMPAIRRAAAEIDPTQPLSPASTMETHLRKAYGDARFLTTLTSSFGFLALLLAVIGVYGVASVGVAQQMRELGVRTALGAGPMRLAGEVVRRSLWPVAAGTLVGGAAAAFVSQSARSLLFGTEPLDPLAYIAAAASLMLTAAAATWLPARRAGRVDPVRALRDDA